MGFEKFVPPPRYKPPRVAIRRTGTVSFNVSAVAAYGLADATHVTIHFDATKKLLGVQPAEPKEEGAFRLTHLKRVASVRARVFFESFGIPLAVTRAYPAEVARNGMVVISLGEIKRKRGRKPARVQR